MATAISTMENRNPYSRQGELNAQPLERGALGETSGNAIGTRGLSSTAARFGGASRQPFQSTQSLRDAFLKVTGDELKEREDGAAETVDQQPQQNWRLGPGLSYREALSSYPRTNTQAQPPSAHSRYTAYRETSPSPGARRYEANENGYFSGSSTSAAEELSDESKRVLKSQHDKKRLYSLTHRPVNATNRKEPEPSPNVPSNWGKPKTKATSDWLAGVHNSSDSDQDALFDIGNDFGGNSANIDLNTDVDASFTGQSMQISTSPMSRAPLSDARKNRPTEGILERLTRTEPESPLQQPQYQAQEDAPQRFDDPFGQHQIGSTTPPSDSSSASSSNQPSTALNGLNSARRRLRGNSKNLLNKLHRQPQQSQQQEQQQQQQQQQTPAAQRIKNDILNAKTPVVTGAWVDTPAPPKMTNDFGVTSENGKDDESHREEDIIEPNLKRRVSASSEEQDVQRVEPTPKTRKVKIEEQENSVQPQTDEGGKHRPSKTKAKPKSILKKPKLPRSALESVLEDIKKGEADTQAGDSTIESLQKLIDNPEAPVEFKPPVVKEESKEPIDLSELVRFVDTKPEEEQEVTKPEPTDKASPALTVQNQGTVEQLEMKLQSLLKQVNDVQSSLAAPGKPTPKNQSSKRQDMALVKDGHSSTYCEVCGRHGDGRIYIAIPIPRFVNRDLRTRRWHLTILGWTTLMLTSYFMLEYLLSTYMYPRYSLSCDRGICIYPNAPRPPFITPTLLWRASGLGYIFAPLKLLVVVVFRLFMQLFGLWDGFVDDKTPPAASSSSFSSVPTSQSGGSPGWFRGWGWGTGASTGNTPAPGGVQDFPSDPGLSVDTDLGMTQDEFI